MTEPNLPPEQVERAGMFNPFAQPTPQELPAQSPDDPNAIDADFTALAGVAHVPPVPTKIVNAPAAAQPEQTSQAAPAATPERPSRIARLRARVGKVAAISLIGAGVGGVVTAGAYVADTHYKSKIHAIANDTYYHRGNSYKLGQQNVAAAGDEEIAFDILAGAGLVTAASTAVGGLALIGAGRKQRREQAKSQPKLSPKERRQARRDAAFAKKAKERGWTKSENKPSKPAETASDGDSDSSEA